MTTFVYDCVSNGQYLSSFNIEIQNETGVNIYALGCHITSILHVVHETSFFKANVSNTGQSQPVISYTEEITFA